MSRFFDNFSLRDDAAVEAELLAGGGGDGGVPLPPSAFKPSVDVSTLDLTDTTVESPGDDTRLLPLTGVRTVLDDPGALIAEDLTVQAQYEDAGIDPDSDEVFDPDSIRFGERFFNDRSIGGGRKILGGGQGRAIPVITDQLNYPDIGEESFFDNFANPRNGVCNFVEFKVFSKKASELIFQYNSVTDFSASFGEAGGRQVKIGSSGIQRVVREQGVQNPYDEEGNDDQAQSPSQPYTQAGASEYFYEGLGDINKRIKEGDLQAKREFVDLVSKDIRAGKATEQVGETIRLYFPNQFSSQDNVEYADTNLNFFQSIVEAFGGAGAANLGSLIGNRSISGIVGGAANLGGVFIPGLDAGEIGNNIQGGINATVGFVENPKNESLFKGVGRKTFQMTFTLAPRTEKESHIAANIVEAFRFHMMPELSLTTTFLLTPNEFEVSLLTFDFESKQFVRNPALPNPGRCFLINTNVDYAPNPKSAFFKNGVACQMTLQLDFAQAFIMNKQLVLGGF